MMKLTLTLLVCALMINYASCGLMCKVGVDTNVVATDCLALTKCYTLKIYNSTSIFYGCADAGATVCKAVMMVDGGGSCNASTTSNVPISTTDATCGLICKVGVDTNAVATDCLAFTRCYTLKINGSTSIIYGCDDADQTVCKAARMANSSSGVCVTNTTSNVPKSTTLKFPICPLRKFVIYNSASDIVATKLMVIPALVLILKRFF